MLEFSLVLFLLALLLLLGSASSIIGLAALSFSSFFLFSILFPNSSNYLQHIHVVVGIIAGQSIASLFCFCTDAILAYTHSFPCCLFPAGRCLQNSKRVRLILIQQNRSRSSVYHLPAAPVNLPESISHHCTGYEYIYTHIKDKKTPVDENPQFKYSKDVFTRLSFNR